MISFRNFKSYDEYLAAVFKEYKRLKRLPYKEISPDTVLTDSLIHELYETVGLPSNNSKPFKDWQYITHSFWIDPRARLLWVLEHADYSNYVLGKGPDGKWASWDSNMDWQ